MDSKRPLRESVIEMSDRVEIDTIGKMQVQAQEICLEEMGTGGVYKAVLFTSPPCYVDNRAYRMFKASELYREMLHELRCWGRSRHVARGPAATYQD